MFTEFPPQRSVAKARLSAFLPDAGRTYAARRNFDLPEAPSVSALSPWVRHRVLTEAEVAGAVLGVHTPQAADKYLQELCWRAYWKGWLERRPAIWAQYRQGVQAGLNRIATETGLRSDWEAACAGTTGIDGFDQWAQQLVETGWLHNHARMWFASIWVFTLKLPWELGADFFLRHLIDGDPASNTLGWRWVAGLHTPGKTYLAKAANISEFTGGRFNPVGLATEAVALRERAHPAPRPPPVSQSWDPNGRTGLLLTEEDLSPDFLFDAGLRPQATAMYRATADRSPLSVAPRVGNWVQAAMGDCGARWSDRLGWLSPVHEGEAGLLFLRDWALSEGLTQVVTPYAPIGPVAEHLVMLDRLLAPQGVRLVRVMRDWDATAWPRATHGFFQFRDVIPHLIAPLTRRR